MLLNLNEIVDCKLEITVREICFYAFKKDF